VPVPAVPVVPAVLVPVPAVPVVPAAPPLVPALPLPPDPPGLHAPMAPAQAMKAINLRLVTVGPSVVSPTCDACRDRSVRHF